MSRVSAESQFKRRIAGHRPFRARRFPSRFANGLFGLALLFVTVASPATEVPLHTDPTKIMGPGNCAECHRPMHETWLHSSHARAFVETHRLQDAREYAREFGILRIKQDSQCVQCHYTVKSDTAESIPRAIAGISCESCHGASRDWNRIHSDTTHPNNLERAEAQGMLRPSNLYELGARCYACHTIPNEPILNRTIHSSGRGFELLAWLQGEVRHNFMKGDTVNREAPPERKRMLYVTGWILDVEFGLRGLAKATREDRFSRTMQRRVAAALKKLEEISRQVEIPQVLTLLGELEDVKIDHHNAERLLQLANRIASLGKKFNSDHDGSKLAALDPLLPSPEDYLGPVYQP